MSTNVFQVEVGKFLKENFKVAVRFDDSSKNKFGGFQVTKKPYDFFGATKNGMFFGAEAKKVQSIRFPFVNLYKHQREALSYLEDNNCMGFLFINWRVNRAGCAIWIPYSEYIEVENRIRLSNFKSIKPTDFDLRWFLTRKSGGWYVPDEHELKELL